MNPQSGGAERCQMNRSASRTAHSRDKVGDLDSHSFDALIELALKELFIKAFICILSGVQLTGTSIVLRIEYANCRVSRCSDASHCGSQIIPGG